MSTIEVKEIAPCKKELLIEIAPTLFETELEKIYKKLGKEVTIPGFRKGKVPHGIIKSKYGEKAEADALNHALPKAFADAIKELKLTLFEKPVIDKVENEKGKPIRFSATFDHLPVFELERFKDFDVELEVIKITDEDVSNEVKGLQEKFSELESISGRSAENGDYAIVDFEGTIDGEPFQGGSNKGIQISLGEGNFMKEFEEGTLGMSLGDTKDVEVNFPENYHNEELAGKKAVFKIRLNELKIKNLPELTDDFVKEHYEEENLAALKAGIRKKLEEKEEGDAKNILRDKIILKIYEANKFDIPDSLIDSQANSIAYNGMRYMGFSDEMIQKNHEHFQKTKEVSLPVARTNVISRLILEKIEKIENFDVAEEELKEELQKHQFQNEIPVEGNQDKEQSHANYIRSKVKNDKITDFLIANNNAKRVDIDRPKDISDNEEN